MTPIEQPSEPICKRCGEMFSVHAGMEPTDYCDPCAQALVAERQVQMNPNIEQAARECAEEFSSGCDCAACKATLDKYVAKILPHMTTLTKPLEEENKRLRDALDWSLTYLENNTGVIPEHYDRYEQAKALTKPT